MKTIILAFLATSVFAGRITYLKKEVQTKVFDNEDLVSFKVEVTPFMAYLPDASISHSSIAFAEIRTQEIDQLKNYVVVQYIKGCVYNLIDGEKVFNVSQQVQNEVRQFKYDDWIIDGLDNDPVYGSLNGERFARYRWNLNDDSFYYETEHFINEKTPMTPRMYVRDIPATSFHSTYDQQTRISNLKFKTCLFREKDVGANVNEGVRINDAIQCFEWDSAYKIKKNELKKIKFNKNNC